MLLQKKLEMKILKAALPLTLMKNINICCWILIVMGLIVLVPIWKYQESYSNNSIWRQHRPQMLKLDKRTHTRLRNRKKQVLQERMKKRRFWSRSNLLMIHQIMVQTMIACCRFSQIIFAYVRAPIAKRS